MAAKTKGFGSRGHIIARRTLEGAADGATCSPPSALPASRRVACHYARRHRDTGKLARGVGRGEAPPPTGYHGSGRAREPVWLKAAIDSFATSINPDGTKEQDLASLV
jgi:hypothetical protein